MESTIGLENIVINDLLANYEDSIYLKNNSTNEYWGWTNATLKSFRRESFIGLRILSGLATLCRLTLGMFICASIASLYIKMTIICAPLFILSICKGI